MYYHLNTKINVISKYYYLQINVNNKIIIYKLIEN